MKFAALRGAHRFEFCVVATVYLARSDEGPGLYEIEKIVGEIDAPAHNQVIDRYGRWRRFVAEMVLVEHQYTFPVECESMTCQCAVAGKVWRCGFRLVPMVAGQPLAECSVGGDNQVFVSCQSVDK